MYVAVPVTTLWTSPDAPRPVDAAAVARRPDVEAWLAALDSDPDGRLGLHGRTLSQLQAGEPVIPVGEPVHGWLEVVCPWQPSSLDPRGYPGWLPVEHVVPGAAPAPANDGPLAAPTTVGDRPVARYAPSREAFLKRASRHAGLQYLWGGTSVHGLDCSGLVHLALRELGVVVPRDADDQHDASQPVRVEDAQPGDLFFFARPGRRPHHVGIVTGPRRMLHAPETGGGGRIVEEELGPEREATLAGAGAFPGASSTP